MRVSGKRLRIFSFTYHTERADNLSDTLCPCKPVESFRLAQHMSKVAAAFAPIGVLLLVLNALGGIVSGIWLAVSGEWWALGVGLVGLFGSHFLVSILLMPNFLFAAAGVALFERGRRGAWDGAGGHLQSLHSSIDRGLGNRNLVLLRIPSHPHTPLFPY